MICKKSKIASRSKLIEAATIVFSAKGFEGASTRDIAKAAGVNHAAISYYFSGKEPLYLACIDKIIGTAHTEVGDVIRHISESVCAPDLTEAQGWSLLDRYIETMVPFFLSRRHDVDTSNIVMRELIDPTPAFERLYDGMMREMYETLSLIIAGVTGLRPGNRKLTICSHAILGQMLGFKNGHAIVVRSLGISDYSDKDVREFISVIKVNTRGIVAAWRKV